MTAMRVIAIRKPGGPEVLQPQMHPVPAIGAGELLIKVRAAGINRPDVSQRLGRYPVPADANPIPGLEVAGVVLAVNDGERRFNVGDRVMALTHGGGYATHCVVDASQTLRIPDMLDFASAAALPEVAFTVEFNLIERAGLKSGETVLIHGGSSGIGSHAIQRAKAAGAKVLVTVGADEKARFCLELGADQAFNYKRDDWPALIMEKTQAAGVDVVLDMVAGDYLQKNLEILSVDGRYALISLQGGRQTSIDLEPVLRRRLTLVGSTLRPLSKHRKAEIAARVERNVLPLVAEGRIAPHICKTFPLDEAADAHRLLESGQHLGKIVLLVNE